MKTLMIHFYREVLGDGGKHSTGAATSAMQRWGIPTLQGNGSARAYRYVDSNDELLAKARARHAEEEAKRAAARGNGHARTAKATDERAVTDGEVIAMLTKLDDAVGNLNATVALLSRSLDERVARTEGKLDSIINYLQSQAQSRPRPQPAKRKG